MSGHNALSSTTMQHSDRNRNRQQVLEQCWRLRPPGGTKPGRQPASTLGLADPHIGDRETTARLAGMSLRSSTTQTRISRTADDARSRTGAAHAAARDNLKHFRSGSLDFRSGSFDFRSGSHCGLAQLWTSYGQLWTVTAITMVACDNHCSCYISDPVALRLRSAPAPLAN